MNAWIAGARPRTLPAAVVPVAVGTAVVAQQGDVVWGRAGLALVVSLTLQVGVNYANDYSDGVRGTDDVRVGPVRLVASGLKHAASVKRAAFLSFGVAMVAGAVLSLVSSPVLLAVGAASILAAWYYTGGKNPYGYRGLGEVSVFVFFGLVAVMGTVFAQLESLPMLAFVASIPVGLLAMALLVVNNLRDRPRDQQTGKRTLAVRLGDIRTRQLYLFCVALPFVVAFVLAATHPWVLLTALALPLMVLVLQPVVRGAQGVQLITVLGATGKLQMAFGLLFSVGLVLS